MTVVAAWKRGKGGSMRRFHHYQRGALTDNPRGLHYTSLPGPKKKGMKDNHNNSAINNHVRREPSAFKF